MYRQECQKLRKELKLAVSALAKELGDDVPVSRVLVRLCFGRVTSNTHSYVVTVDVDTAVMISVPRLY